MHGAATGIEQPPAMRTTLPAGYACEGCCRLRGRRGHAVVDDADAVRVPAGCARQRGGVAVRAPCSIAVEPTPAAAAIAAAATTFPG